VIPRLVAEGLRVFAYPFGGYWVDVGTIEAYWQTQMDLLRTPPPLDLNDRSWIIHTLSEEQPPVRIQTGAMIKDSLVTDGCVIGPDARVERSVLSPGVVVGAGALVRESVVLSGASVGDGARIQRAIVDKLVRVGRAARVGAMGRAGEPALLTTIGKNAVIPDRAVVPAGAAAAADAVAEQFVPAKAAPIV
jgi:glucose-1-phosphate adenylyltransferase